MLARLAHVVIRHRFIVIGAWIVLTIFGAYAAGQVSKRWYQSFSIPGKSAYETNQRTLKAFGVGVRPPNVVVFKTDGDATKSEAIRAASERVQKANPGALTSSYFSTAAIVRLERPAHNLHGDLSTGLAKFDTKSGAVRDARRPRPAGCRAGPGSTSPATTRSRRRATHGDGGGPSVLLEAVVGGLGALMILLFVFGTCPRC